MESSGDSDRYSVQTAPPDESDIDTQLLVEQENADKQDIIDNLQKELSICRAQFEQSVAINKKVENVHNKNQKLATALQNLQSEKDELARRLEISIKANEELESKLNNERFVSSQQISKGTTDKDRELAKIKKEYDSTIEEMTKKIETLETEKQTLELNNKMITNKIDRILQNSNQYFGFTFTEPDSLIDFLLQPHVKEVVQPEEPKNIADPNSISTIEKKNRLLKQKFKDLRIQSGRIVKENEQLKKQLQESEKRNFLLTQKYEDQIEQIKEENSSNLSLFSETETNLNAKIQKLKSDNKKLKQELNELRSEKITSQPPQILSNSNNSVKIQTENKSSLNHVTFQDEIDIVQKKNDELQEKLKISEQKNDQLSIQIKEIQSKNDRLEIELENEKVSMNALKVVHDETLSEVSTLRESLHQKCNCQPPKPLDKKVLSKLKAKLDHSQKTIRLMTRQIQDLQIQLEADKNQRIQIESNLIGKCNELDEARQKVSSMNDELSILRQQIEEKPSLTADDIIPSYAWRFNEFDQSLSQKIEKVALNPLLQPVSKLNSVYKIIQKFYDEILREKEAENAKISAELQDLKAKMNKFVVDVSVHLSLNPLTITDFLTNNFYSETIVQKLASMVKEVENLKRKDGCYASVIDLLLNCFDDQKAHNSADFYSNPENLHLFVTGVKNKSQSLEQKLRQKSHKLRTYKLIAKELKQATDDEISMLKNELSNKTNDLMNLKQNYDMLCEMNQKLKKELHSSKKNFSEFQQKSEENESNMQDEFDKKMLNQQTVHNMSEQTLKKQVDQLLAEKEGHLSAIENYELSISRLKTTIEKNQHEIKEKEKMILELTNDKNSFAVSIEEKYKQEKENLIKSYEKVVSKIKKQCDNQRTDLEKVSLDLAASEKRNSSCKKAIVTLKRDKIKLENEIKAIYDQVKRDRQINEADTNTKILAAETGFSRKLNDYKNKHESEKKRIFSYAANEFRQFFNPSETLDEKSFKSLLSKIRREYDKLSFSDANVRRLVGANPNQPTEEAVAHILS